MRTSFQHCNKRPPGEKRRETKYVLDDPGILKSKKLKKRLEKAVSNKKERSLNATDIRDIKFTLTLLQTDPEKREELIAKFSSETGISHSAVNTKFYGIAKVLWDEVLSERQKHRVTSAPEKPSL